MPSPQYFDKCPQFPHDVETADLPTVSLALLEKGHESETLRLFDACREYGFFALDLRDSDHGSPLVKDAENMFDLADETLNLDQATLFEHACKPPKDLMGYKQAGTTKVEGGKFDAVEVYSISQDDMLGNVTSRSQPAPIQQHRNECREFFERAYKAVAVVLHALDLKLGLPAGTLSRLSAPNRESATSLRFILTKPQESPVKSVSFGAHTDIGLITLLFHVAGGLQILPAECENKDENWRYVTPIPHCALVNLGDTMVEWTGGVLRSSLHRVVTAPGEQAHVPRISLAYLIRPARAETMRRLHGNGSVIPPPTSEDPEDEQGVDSWAAEKAYRFMQGIVQPRTKGGAPIAAK